jgi:anti-sigma factor RsiW
LTQGHLGDVLSALLDGELADAALVAAETHLEGCAECTHELRLASEARELIRGLPPVEPPATFYPALLAGRRRRLAVAALASAAVAGLTFVGLRAPQESPVTPPVNQLVLDHAATASVSGDPVSELVPVGVPVAFRR